MEPKAEAGCVLKVDVQCDECKMKLMEVLSSISGVYSVNIDAEQGIAKVVGEVEPNTLLGALSRPGKHAELVRVTFKDSNYDRYASSLPHPYNQQYGYGYNTNYDYPETNYSGGYLPPAQYDPSYPMQVDKYEDAALTSFCTIM